MKKILLLSVPHTGTIFVRDYLMQILHLPFIADANNFISEKRNAVAQTMHTTGPQLKANKTVNGVAEYAIDNCNVIIPFRHPMDNAISCIGRDHPNLEFCATNWSILFEMYPLYNVFWVDIDAPKENRRNMMEQLNGFVGCYPISADAFDKYVDDWAPVNNLTKANPIKKAYVENGTLPKGFDYSVMDEAVVWHSTKKQELLRKYI